MTGIIPVFSKGVNLGTPRVMGQYGMTMNMIETLDYFVGYYKQLWVQPDDRFAIYDEKTTQRDPVGMMMKKQDAIFLQKIHESTDTALIESADAKEVVKYFRLNAKKKYRSLPKKFLSLMQSWYSSIQKISDIEKNKVLITKYIEQYEFTSRGEQFNLLTRKV